MEQYKIGTCVPGRSAEKWLPHMINMGYECFSLNWHMELYGADLKDLSEKIMPVLEGTGIPVTTLGLYCNPLANEDHKKNLEYVIDSAHYFGATTIGTFAGALTGESVEASMPKFKEVFSELAKRAEANGLKLVIENCPMGGSWRKTTSNIGFHPRAWDMMFNEVPAENLGLEWEPTHQLCQLIDPMPQIRKYGKKILHIHGKDATVDRQIIAEEGIHGPNDYLWHRMPGLGDCDWRTIITYLHMVGYEGDICIEGYHDPIYANDWEATGQLHALNYLKWARCGDFTPNPWKR
ncbi:MAG: sugar phosphate isomerase/epimerase [Clostridia bacterium]|nr:sugar phosphate isomerase/epimerase [Clostridia bacterium]